MVRALEAEQRMLASEGSPPTSGAGPPRPWPRRGGPGRARRLAREVRDERRGRDRLRGSFAGLAAAGRSAAASWWSTACRSARRDVGVRQPLRVLQLDLLDCVEQVHEDIWLHTPPPRSGSASSTSRRSTTARFCSDLFARTGAEFSDPDQRGDGVVQHRSGAFTAPIVIEAAGWRTSAPKHRRPPARPPRKSFGVEARQPYRGDGLHFGRPGWATAAVSCWTFPAGDHVRAGLAHYNGHSALSGDLAGFLERHDLGEPGHQHGGFFTSRLIDPIRDGMFVVGDAAGQCLPVSGEDPARPGVRPARRPPGGARRTGELPLDQALSRYRAYVLSARGYRFLDRLQSILNVLPDPLRRLRALLADERVRAGRSTATGRSPTPTCSRRCPSPSPSRWWPPPSERRREGFPGAAGGGCQRRHAAETESRLSHAWSAARGEQPEIA